MPLDFAELDRIRHQLKQQFPGWQIWYVPRTWQPGLNPGVTWCGQPWPLINAQSTEHLTAEIIQAHTEAAGNWPALASLQDYGAIAPGIPRAGKDD